jgi:putative DNA methylase
MPRGTVGHVFATHVIPMTWDFPEANPFSSFHCSWTKNADWIAKVVERTYPKLPAGHVSQQDARSADYTEKVVSTDPPYYDNVPYADISDYFYVWQRRALKQFYPELYGSIQTPKSDELVADVQRWGNEANKYFMNGMTDVMSKIAEDSSPYFPITIYYAFKQSETKDVETASRGWEAFLEAVIASGLQITGTWPIRTERGARSRARGSNVLASSIVLVCHRRESKSTSVSRRDFQRKLREELPEALETMIGGRSGRSPIAPVDLAQSAIGPGMAIYSKYESVLNQDGSRMSVHDALILINRAISEYLSPESGTFDADTQFCSSWFDQYGWSTGPFGEGDTLARAKGTSVEGVQHAGVLKSGAGKVRLLRWQDYPKEWDPTKDDRTPIWEACHQLIRCLNSKGETVAGGLLAKMPEKGEAIRQLAYHLYTLCERKNWAEDARAYNELITSWHAIIAASLEIGHTGTQVQLDLDA